MVHALLTLTIASAIGLAHGYTPDSGVWEIKLTGRYGGPWELSHCGLSSDNYMIKRYTKGTHALGESCKNNHDLGIYLLEDQSGNVIKGLSCDNNDISFVSRTFIPDSDGFYVGVDRVGNDLERTTAADPTECQEKCGQRDGCFYFAWASDGTNYCWLKDKANVKTSNGDRVSGQRYCHLPTPQEGVTIGERGGMCANGYYTLPNELTQYAGLTTPDWGGNVPGWNKGNTATWTRVKMNFDTLVVDASNSAAASKYASVSGTKFAAVADCKTTGSATGKMKIDLRGTPFAIKDQPSCDNYAYGSHRDCGQWHGHGWSSRTKVTCSNNNQFCVVECGGYCGGCTLNNNELKLKIVDQALYDSQCPTKTANPTAAPTAAPTTQSFFEAKQLSDNLDVFKWQTGVDGDTVYKCDQTTNECYINSAGDRNSWTIFTGIPEVAMGGNPTITTPDGTVFTSDLEKIVVRTAEGNDFDFPWECQCDNA